MRYRLEQPGHRKARSSSSGQWPLADYHGPSAYDLRGDYEEGYLDVFEMLPAGPAFEPLLRLLAADNARPGERDVPKAPPRAQARHAGEFFAQAIKLGRAMARHVSAADYRPHARTRQHVDRHLLFFEHTQHADVG